MAGLTGHLLGDSVSPFQDGMVNYRLVADALGLVYDEQWLEDFGYSLENRIESLISHDSAPNGSKEDPHWVYLNSGFHQIAGHLHNKYYTKDKFLKLGFKEFRDVLFFELVGMAQDQVNQNGHFFENDEPNAYDIRAVAEHFGLASEPDWIDAVINEWLHSHYVYREEESDKKSVPRFFVTQLGYEHAETLAEQLSQADGLLLRQGTGQLYFSVDASHISRLGMELVARSKVPSTHFC
jgi:hypothetical protein